MRITDRLIQLRAVAVNVGGFVKRHQRPSMAVAGALLIAGPLLTRTGGEDFLLNPVSGGAGSGGLGHRRPGGAPDRPGRARAGSAAATDGFNSTTGRRSMTTMTLGAPPSIGPFEELADRLRQSGDPASRTGQDRDGTGASLTDRKDGNLEVVAVPAM